MANNWSNHNALSDQFWVQMPGTSADTVWLNRAEPPAKGGLIGSNITTSNKDAAPRGFEFLKNVGENPDPARSKFGSGPLADRGGVDDAIIVRLFRDIRRLDPLAVPLVAYWSLAGSRSSPLRRDQQRHGTRRGSSSPLRERASVRAFRPLSNGRWPG